MISIPNWNDESLVSLEEIAQRNAAIDKELEECERQAMQEFLAVPSYVEVQASKFASEQ